MISASNLTVVMLYGPDMPKHGQICSDAIRRHMKIEPIVFTEFICKQAPPWNKIHALLRVHGLRPWTLWVDADCLLLRPICLTQYIRGYDADIHISVDYNGFNTGIMLVHSSEWSRKFLEATLAVGDVLHNSSYGDPGPRCEQNVIKCMAESFTEPSRRVAHMGKELASDTKWGYKPERPFYHAWGIPLDEKLKILKQLSESNELGLQTPTDARTG